jgi:Uma2 family endonuclease
MTTLTAEPPAEEREQHVETVAEIVGRVQDVPLDRIIWHPFPATEDDVLRLSEAEPKRLCELVNGLLVEKVMGHQESLLAGWLITCLNNFVVPRRLGIVGAPDAFMRLAPGMVRLPDVAFIHWTALPSPDAHRRPVAAYAPELAVEILSERNTRREIERKRREYFEAGTRLVWIVDPRAETVAVFTGADRHTMLTTADTLNGGDVLPGFELRVADLFGYLDPPAAPPQT